MGVSKGGGGSRKGPSKGGARMGGGPGDRDLHFSKAQKSRGGKTKAGKGVGWLRDPRWATSEDMSKTNKQLREERAKDTKKSGPVKTFSAKERAKLQSQMFGDASKTPGETKGKRTGPAKGSSKASKAAATRAKNKAAAAKKGRGPKTVEARRQASRRAGQASRRRAGGSAPMKPATTRIGGGPYRPKSIGATLKDILE